MATLSTEQVALVGEILAQARRSPPTFPAEPEFRVAHVNERSTIDELLNARVLAKYTGHYVPTLGGLRACGTDGARAAIRDCNRLLEVLKEKVRREPRKVDWTPDEIREGSTFTGDDTKVLLTILLLSGEHRFSSGWQGLPESPFIAHVSVRLDGVLDAQPVPETEPPLIPLATGPGSVERIHIHNFRSFVNFEWKPPAACVLVGDNGAGKSSLVEVLWLLQDLLVEGKAIEETSVASARPVSNPSVEPVIEIDVRGATDSFRYRLVVGPAVGRGSIKEELSATDGVLYRSNDGRVELFGDTPSAAPRTVIPFDRRRSFIASLEPRADNRRLTAFREAIRSIWAMKPDPLRIIGSTAGESRYLARDLSNFASWYQAKSSEDPEALAALLADLKQALRGFASLRFVPISPDVKDLLVQFSFGGKRPPELRWSQLSDGQRLLIALYGVLHFGLVEATLIVLDEAENYVAPGEIQPWFRALVDAAAERKQQVLVVSHNPESINYMAADAAWRMWRDLDSGHTRIAPLSPDLEAGETAYGALKLGTPEATAGEDPDR